MTRKTIRIARVNGSILLSEIGPGNVPFSQKRLSESDLAATLLEAGLPEPEVGLLLAEFHAIGFVMVSFIPNGPIHHRD